MRAQPTRVCGNWVSPVSPDSETNARERNGTCSFEWPGNGVPVPPTRFRSVLASRSNISSAFQLPRAPRKLVTFTATSSAARSEIFSDIL